MKCRFEIVGLSGIDGVPMHLKINGKSKYKRLLIKKVKEEEPKDVALLMEYNKKFLIIGNMNAITYKEIFPLIKENKMWLGVSTNGSNRWFRVPQDYEHKPNAAGYKEENGKKFLFVNGIMWFTNLDHDKRHQPIDLYKKYNAEEYPKYDNYDAIDVSKVCEIPMDYDGVIGVPITFLIKYCPTQFEIIKFRKGNDDKDLSVNGKCPYFRILIKRVF